MLNITDLEKKINSELNTKVSSSKIVHETLNVSIEKDDLKEKEIVMKWMNESWKKLKIFFPKIHLAQIHNHLNSHEEEVYLSFEERLNELKNLKNICDPDSILPPL